MNIQRILNLPELLKKKSFFLFGPRATGKTFMIRQQLNEQVLNINLLNSRFYLMLSAAPHELEALIAAEPSKMLIVIDEIQRVPELLNEVHRLIEEKGLTFLLTGSSTRKLRRHGHNLLAGRAWEARLFPLTFIEIPNFDLEKYLLYGGLPPVYLSQDPAEELCAYINTYLKEEIQAESLVRSLPAFSRFLQTSALTSGQMLNFTEIASDTGIPVSSVREYYHILEDTFMGTLLPAYTKTTKRKAISTAKFYWFDVGVKHALTNIRHLESQSDLYGQAFEHFIVMEINAYLNYRRLRLPLTYWRSTHGQEVDLIIGDEMAIEIKSTQNIASKHLKGLKIFEEEQICRYYFLISQDMVQRKYESIEVCHWKVFLERLWQNEWFF